MTIEIGFVKLASRWFAMFPYYPDGDVEDLEMIGNAQTFLNDVYNYRHWDNGVINIKILENKEGADFVFNKMKDEFVNGEAGVNYELVKSRIETVNNVWLCPVLKWFYNGEYPENIYIKLQ